MAPSDKNPVLAGDIGGTKTNLGLFARGKTRPILKVFETYGSREASNLEQIISHFLEKYRIPISGACFGIAGPVINGRCKATNLPWEVSEAALGRRFGWKMVRLLNDLAATAMAVPVMKGNERAPINRAKSRGGGTLSLIAPGTGLGEAVLVRRAGGLFLLPSEGGHVDFAPNDEDQVELWQYLHKKFGHVSIERVISGPGLLNIYNWLRDSGRYEEPEWLREKIRREDPGGVITETARKSGHPLCTEALKVFLSVLGAAAGNLALTTMATEGLYLCGGIPPKILPELRQGYFMEAFTAKGRFKEFMEKVPVWVILNERAALLGAAVTIWREQALRM